MRSSSRSGRSSNNDNKILKIKINFFVKFSTYSIIYLYYVLAVSYFMQSVLIWEYNLF